MIKLQIYSQKTILNPENKPIVESGQQYTGTLTDDRQILTITGIDGQTISIQSFDEEGNSQPYYLSPDARDFYVIRQLEPMISIETDVWLPNPEKPGYVSLSHKRTLEEVYKDIVQALKEQEVWEMLDYFNISTDKRDGKVPFPDYRWISVFLVRGGSEGFYFHIEAIHEGKRELIYLGKTLSERIDEALKINNVLVKLFHS